MISRIVIINNLAQKDIFPSLQNDVNGLAAMIVDLLRVILLTFAHMLL